MKRRNRRLLRPSVSSPLNTQLKFDAITVLLQAHNGRASSCWQSTSRVWKKMKMKGQKTDRLTHRHQMKMRKRMRRQAVLTQRMILTMIRA